MNPAPPPSSPSASPATGGRASKAKKKGKKKNQVKAKPPATAVAADTASVATAAPPHKTFLPLATLPADVLHLIFAFLPRRPRRLVLSLVCKRFHSLLKNPPPKFADRALVIGDRPRSAHAQRAAYDPSELVHLSIGPHADVDDVHVLAAASTSLTSLAIHQPVLPVMNLELFSQRLQLPKLRKLLASVPVACNILPFHAAKLHSLTLVALTQGAIELHEGNLVRLLDATNFPNLRDLELDVTHLSPSLAVKAAAALCAARSAGLSLHLRPAACGLLASEAAALAPVLSRLTLTAKPSNLEELLLESLAAYTALKSLALPFNVTIGHVEGLRFSRAAGVVTQLSVVARLPSLIELLVHLCALPSLTTLCITFAHVTRHASVLTLPALQHLTLKGLEVKDFVDSLPSLTALLTRLPVLRTLTLEAHLAQYRGLPDEERDVLGAYIGGLSQRFPSLEAVSVPRFFFGLVLPIVSPWLTIYTTA